MYRREEAECIGWEEAECIEFASSTWLAARSRSAHRPRLRAPTQPSRGATPRLAAPGCTRELLCRADLGRVRLLCGDLSCLGFQHGKNFN